jgi:hypothetical protein
LPPLTHLPPPWDTVFAPQLAKLQAAAAANGTLSSNTSSSSSSSRAVTPFLLTPHPYFKRSSADIRKEKIKYAKDKAAAGILLALDSLLC